jgi:hypothetical protein
MRAVPPNLLNSQGDAERLHIFSDYSKGPNYRTYCYVVTDLAASGDSLQQLTELRSESGLTRRMSYKDLGDKKRIAVLPGFCEATRSISGHAITFAVSNSITSLFHRSGNLVDPTLAEAASRYRAAHVQEHLARVLHFFAFTLAGMSRAGQHVDWFTDVDEIVPEQDWLKSLTDLSANMASHYLCHNLGDFRVGTTRSDDGSLLLEDLCAVPDLFAGSVAQALSHQSVDSLSMPNGLVIPLKSGVRQKAVDVLRSLRNESSRLKHTCLCIEPDEDRWRIQVRYFHEIPIE